MLVIITIIVIISVSYIIISDVMYLNIEPFNVFKFCTAHTTLSSC